jgi:PAS domain S-box-containing protein
MSKDYESGGGSERHGLVDLLKMSEERFRQLVEGVKDYAIFMLDPDGYILSWNEGAERIKGYTAREAIGRHFSMFYPQEKIDVRWPETELEAARKEGRFEDEGWRLRKDGSRFWANVIITALRDDDGTLIGYSKITRDLSERRDNEEALRQSEERFRLLVEGVKDYAIFMLDPDGYIMSWNEGAERIKGYTAREAIGRHFSMFYPQEKIDERWPETELEAAKKEGRFEDEGWRLRKDGSRFWANVIITALYDSTGALRGFAKVTRDMSERKRVEALELAERRMTEFLAMLSHELRNPLAPIRNAIYMMQIKELDDPDLKWMRDILDRQVTHLTRLVDDLMEVSRVTSGNIRLHKEEYDMRTVVARAVESSRPLIDARHHHLAVHLDDAPLPVEGDMTRLTQVLVNLLNNATKYTPENGKIEVRAERLGENVVVHVCDNGVGIPRELLPSVFDIFKQGERTLDRSEGGLGLGLTLARRIVEMHKGTISAASDGPGTGSEFTVVLPAVAHQREATAISEEPTPGVVSLHTDTRVLIVDDNVDAALSMKLFLKAWGFDVRIVYDGVSAVTAAAEYRPDIILLDIGLPGMSGYDAASEIRKLDGGKRITIVAVTGYGQEEDRRRTREVGMDHHLVKPIDPQGLRKLLAAIRTGN